MRQHDNTANTTGDASVADMPVDSATSVVARMENMANAERGERLPFAETRHVRQS
ncbi:hypothetical protein [Hallella colorans]|uniref:hypothetical protein n=1 Tax=Hallella colorans TaxID=1703337 RepID=UPI0023F4C124|nr:hypothetical protein [Hallella colorans]